MGEGLTIGVVRVEPPLVLAPMSGVTDVPFRRLVKRARPGSLGLLFTEFASSEALSRRIPCQLRLLRLDPEDHPIAVQIYGRDPARMADAAAMAQQAGADIVDINAGCPARNVVQHGGGANLMREPELLAAIVRAVRAVLQVPLTVKIRSGWDSDSINAVEIARRLVDAGVEALTVHGRTRAQAYSGQADWGIVRRVREAVPVPVIGNGDVNSPEVALERWTTSGAAGLMIGRAAMGNPWIFGQIHDALLGRPRTAPQPAQRLRWWLDYGEALRESLPDKAIIGRMKQLAVPMTRGLPQGVELRRRIYACPHPEAVRQVLLEASAFGELPPGEAEWQTQEAARA